MALTALVVEDSPTMRQLIVFAISRIRGLTVIEADDGVDALKKLAGGHFDIILTDINMPVMDGLKLVKRVRGDELLKNIPIVIITTEGAEEDRQRALALGANAYSTKPIQAPQGIANVKELLKLVGLVGSSDFCEGRARAIPCAGGAVARFGDRSVPRSREGRARPGAQQ